MGEVNNMKKVISVVMCAVMLLCCACFAGCQQKKLNPTPNDLINALKAGGYEDSYFISDDMANAMSDIDRSGSIEVVGTKGNIYIETMTGIDKQIARGGMIIENYSGSENKEDAIKILNIIMPLFDDDFNNSGEDIINHLEELSKDKNNARENYVLGSSYYNFNYNYHNIDYLKCQDENYKDIYILINTFPVYLERNNITLEDSK